MASKELLRTVARLSFESDFTIPEIAAYIANTGDKKNGTVKRVSTLLAEASKWLLKRDQMLVDYEAETTNYKLADKLREKYPVLKNVLVTRSIPVSPDAPWEPILNLTNSRLAAQYFDALTEDEQSEVRVAISGSELLLDVATAIPHHQRQHVHYYASAIIGRPRMLRATHIGPDTNATVCWIQSGMISGNLHYATTDPPEFSSDTPKTDAEHHKKAKNELIEDAKFHADNAVLKVALSDLAEVNIVISDIGAFRPLPIGEPSDLMEVSSLLRHYGVNPTLLAEEGAVGYMSYAIFDENGETRDDWQFFLNAGYPNTIGFFKSLVKQEQKVIVVAEATSDPALRVALNARLFNILITDEATATYLLASSPPRFRVPLQSKSK